MKSLVCTVMHCLDNLVRLINYCRCLRRLTRNVIVMVSVQKISVTLSVKHQILPGTVYTSVQWITN